MKFISFYSLLVLSIVGPVFIQANFIPELKGITELGNAFESFGSLRSQAPSNLSTGKAKKQPKSNQNEVKDNDDNDNDKIVVKERVNKEQNKIHPMKTHYTTKEVQDDDNEGDERKHGYKQHASRRHDNNDNYSDKENDHGKRHQNHGYDHNKNNNHDEHYHGRHHGEHKENNHDF